MWLGRCSDIFKGRVVRCLCTASCSLVRVQTGAVHAISLYGRPFFSLTTMHLHWNRSIVESCILKRSQINIFMWTKDHCLFASTELHIVTKLTDNYLPPLQFPSVLQSFAATVSCFYGRHIYSCSFALVLNHCKQESSVEKPLRIQWTPNRWD